MMAGERDRLADVRLDESSLSPANSNVEHERRVALFDLIESNQFGVAGHDCGPYVLDLSMQEGRLAFQVADEAGAGVVTHIISLSPVRKMIKDPSII